MFSERVIDKYFPHATSNTIARHISGRKQQLLISGSMEMNFTYIISYIKHFFILNFVILLVFLSHIELLTLFFSHFISKGE